MTNRGSLAQKSPQTHDHGVLPFAQGWGDRQRSRGLTAGSGALLRIDTHGSALGPGGPELPLPAPGSFSAHSTFAHTLSAGSEFTHRHASSKTPQFTHHTPLLIFTYPPGKPGSLSALGSFTGSAPNVTFVRVSPVQLWSITGPGPCFCSYFVLPLCLQRAVRTKGGPN